MHAQREVNETIRKVRQASLSITMLLNLVRREGEVRERENKGRVRD